MKDIDKCEGCGEWFPADQLSDTNKECGTCEEEGALEDANLKAEMRAYRSQAL